MLGQEDCPQGKISEIPELRRNVGVDADRCPICLEDRTDRVVVEPCNAQVTETGQDIRRQRASCDRNCGAGKPSDERSEAVEKLRSAG